MHASKQFRKRPKQRHAASAKRRSHQIATKPSISSQSAPHVVNVVAVNSPPTSLPSSAPLSTSTSRLPPQQPPTTPDHTIVSFSPHLALSPSRSTASRLFSDPSPRSHPLTTARRFLRSEDEERHFDALQRRKPLTMQQMRKRRISHFDDTPSEGPTRRTAPSQAYIPVRHIEHPELSNSIAAHQYTWDYVRTEHERLRAGSVEDREFTGTNTDTELEQERLRLKYFNEEVRRREKDGHKSRHFVRDLLRVQEDIYRQTGREHYIEDLHQRYKDPYKAFYSLERKIRERDFRNKYREEILANPFNQYPSESELNKRPNIDDYQIYDGHDFNSKKGDIVEGWWDKGLVDKSPRYNREGHRIYDSDEVNTDDLMMFGDNQNSDGGDIKVGDQTQLRGVHLNTSDIEGGYLGPFGYDLKPDYYDLKLIGWFDMPDPDTSDHWASHPVYGDGPLDMPHGAIHNGPSKQTLDFNYGPFSYLYYLKIDRIQMLRLQKLRKEYDYYYREREIDLKWKDSDYISRLFEDYWTKGEWKARKMQLEEIQAKLKPDNLYDLNKLYGGYIRTDSDLEDNVDAGRGLDAKLKYQNEIAELRAQRKTHSEIETILHEKYSKIPFEFDGYGNRVTKLHTVDLATNWFDFERNPEKDVNSEDGQEVSERARLSNRKKNAFPDYVATSEESELYSEIPSNDDGIGMDVEGFTRKERRELRFQQLSAQRKFRRLVDRLDNAILDKSVINTHTMPELYALGAEDYLKMIRQIELTLASGNFDPNDIVLKRFLRARQRGLFEDPAYRFDVFDDAPDSSFSDLSNESDIYNDFDPTKNDAEHFSRFAERTSSIIQNDSLYKQESLYLEQGITPDYFENPLFIPRPLNMTLKWPSHLPRIPPGQPPGLVPVSPVYTDETDSGMYSWDERDFAGLPPELVHESSPEDSQGEATWDPDETKIWDSDDFRQNPDKLKLDHWIDVKRIMTSSDWERGPSTTSEESKRFVNDNQDPLFQMPLPKRVSRGKEIFPPTPDSIAMYRGDIEGRGNDIQLPGFYMHQRYKDATIQEDMLYDWINEDDLIRGVNDKAEFFQYAYGQARHQKPHVLGVDPLRFATDAKYHRSVTYSSSRYTRPKPVQDYGQAYLAQSFNEMVGEYEEVAPQYEDWKQFTKFERELIRNDPKERHKRETMLKHRQLVYAANGGRPEEFDLSRTFFAKHNPSLLTPILSLPPEAQNEAEYQYYKSIDPSQKDIIDRRDPLLDSIYFSDDELSLFEREWQHASELMDKFMLHRDEERAQKLDLMEKITVENELFRRKGKLYTLDQETYNEMYLEDFANYGTEPETNKHYVEQFMTEEQWKKQWEPDYKGPHSFRYPGETPETMARAREEAQDWVMSESNPSDDALARNQIYTDISVLTPTYPAKKYNRRHGASLSGANFLKPVDIGADLPGMVHRTPSQKLQDDLLLKHFPQRTTLKDVFDKLNYLDDVHEHNLMQSYKSIDDMPKPNNWPPSLPWPPSGHGLKLKDIPGHFFDSPRQYQRFKNFMKRSLREQVVGSEPPPPEPETPPPPNRYDIGSDLEEWRKKYDDLQGGQGGRH